MINLNPETTSKQVLLSNAFGQHALGKLVDCAPKSLVNLQAFKIFIEQEINFHKLNNLGAVYHAFAGGGFTAVVCLSESHLSVHTWPEENFLTFDVFLSNYQRNNEDKTKQLVSALEKYFGGSLTDFTFLYR